MKRQQSFNFLLDNLGFVHFLVFILKNRGRCTWQEKIRLWELIWEQQK